MDPEAKGDQRGDWAAETTSGAGLKPPKQTLTLSKSDGSSPCCSQKLKRTKNQLTTL
ncbi:MAG: hypothetical protein GY696_20460 [Gammaproteobacteria bacterium]|nr:hypothetical protein [Gammaproteobacteria bacterium]